MKEEAAADGVRSKWTLRRTGGIFSKFPFLISGGRVWALFWDLEISRSRQRLRHCPSQFLARGKGAVSQDLEDFHAAAKHANRAGGQRPDTGAQVPPQRSPRGQKKSFPPVMTPGAEHGAH